MLDKLKRDDIRQDIYQDVLNFTQDSLFLEDYFVCIYGSCVTSYFHPQSDLDIVFAAERCNEEDFAQIQDFVLSQHHKYGLEIDQEVPYRNKLLVTYQDIEQAASLDVFQRDEDGNFIVPEITDDIEFLSSKDARKRLLLNVFTTPHIFVAGNQVTYKFLRLECEKSIVRLARGIGSAAVAEGTGILSALLNRQEDGSSGRDYLGYKQERPEVVAYLQQMIARNID